MGGPANRLPASNAASSVYAGFSLCDISPYVLGEYLVDQCLIPDTSTTSFLPELLEHSGVHADRDKPARCVTKRRTAHAPHPTQLRLGRLGNVAEINPARRTPRVRAGSHGAR
jgi:hypothetical protein